MDEHRIGDKAVALANNLKTTIGTAAETISDVAGRAQTAAVEAGNTVHGAAIEAGKQVGDAATQAYQQTVRAGEYVSRNTAEQPLLALLIAGAVGYGIAYMIHHR
jgi:ElaB/YqjD/DUF883 family membrane-anchored ribosome-binding protein